MNIGVIGLGRMGSIFAKRLIEQDHSLYLWNRSPASTQQFADTSARCCRTPAEVAAKSDVVIVSLANEAALQAVYRGEDGLLSAPLAGTCIVETSTVRPDVVVDLAALATQCGGALVDAPVLGTIGPAREGKIVVVTGGEPSAIEKVRPVLSGLSRRQVHMGAVGMGSTMKLVVNMGLCVYWQSLGEALAMGERHGLGLDAMLDVLVDSPIATAALNGKLPVLRGASVEVGFDVAGARKDLSAALMTAHAVDVQATAAAGALAGFTAAVEGGFGEEDVARIVAFNRALKAQS